MPKKKTAFAAIATPKGIPSKSGQGNERAHSPAGNPFTKPDEKPLLMEDQEKIERFVSSLLADYHEFSSKVLIRFRKNRFSKAHLISVYGLALLGGGPINQQAIVIEMQERGIQLKPSTIRRAIIALEKKGICKLYRAPVKSRKHTERIIGCSLTTEGRQLAIRLGFSISPTPQDDHMPRYISESKISELIEAADAELEFVEMLVKPELLNATRELFELLKK